jgi:hypothetical protein
MDYTKFPNTPESIPTPTGTNQVSAKNIYGSSTMGGGGVINLGGENGVYIDGVQGVYAGDLVFASAPFSVDLNGNLVATSATISGSVSSGTPGGKRIVLDPSGGTLKIYDSSGNVVGEIYANTNNMFISTSENPNSMAISLYNDPTTPAMTISGPISEHLVHLGSFLLSVTLKEQ